MEPNVKNLGKVSITAGGKWNRSSEYERLTLVYREVDNYSFLSKQDVPANIDLDNTDYWQRVGVAGYKNNNIIILSDYDSSTGELISHTLSSAINVIHPVDRRPGLVLGFYGANAVTGKYSWYLYQYKDNNINNWTNEDKWGSLSEEVSKFKGYFKTIEDLTVQYPIAQEGQFAFVGETLEKAYVCVPNESGEWEQSPCPALEFVNLYKGVHSRDVGELDTNIDLIHADSALKDALGRIIHDTYITRDGLEAAMVLAIAKSFETLTLPDGFVTMNSLSEAVKQYIGSGGKVVNNADDEDLCVKNNVLKFADKKHNLPAFSGLGRVYLRKNIVDGINLLEQYMINEPNTIYVLQYDYCLNESTITIPENCIIEYQGGSINRGIVVLNNTKFVNFVGSIKDFIVADMEGTFAIGQQDYDKNSLKPIWFNGEFWTDVYGNDINAPA